MTAATPQFNSFVSIVGVLFHRDDLSKVQHYLKNLYPILKAAFADYEVILVNNIPGAAIDGEIEVLTMDLKHNVYLLNLSAETNRNHAIIAGLDRANGDYTVIFDLEFWQKPEYVVQLFEKAQAGNDIVYLQAPKRNSPLRFRWLYNIFYFILSKYSNLQIDDLAHNSRIISRRALNSLLRLRENLRYMKAIYSVIGYRTTALPVSEPLTTNKDEKFGDQFRTSLVAISSFTTFLRTLLLWIFLGSLLFLIIVVINAIKVKTLGSDIFGVPHEALPGWTFQVVLISIFFAVVNLNLYIMSIYLSNIYFEIKQRPLYIIESIKRF